MHFCVKCNNMYYTSIKDSNTLAYYCRNCGHVDDTIHSDNICVSKTFFKKNTTQTYTHAVNKYTKMDPTLPRITTIKCPNVECKSNKKEKNPEESGADASSKNEIIYVRYDDTSLKFVYLCTKCDTLWKTEQTS